MPFLARLLTRSLSGKTLYENIRDVFFPVKLPPLDLTSTPIPVPDRMAVKANPWAIGISTTFNRRFCACVLWRGHKDSRRAEHREASAAGDQYRCGNVRSESAEGRCCCGRRWWRWFARHCRSDQGQTASADEGPNYATDGSDSGAAQAGGAFRDQRAAEHSAAR